MILSWLRLLRIPNLPSAATNVIAGAALGSVLAGAKIEPLTLLWACTAAVAVYACGLVWNDLADEAFDRRARPERPLPRGEISRRSAWILSIALLGVAALAGTQLPQDSRWILGAVSVLAFLYDFALKASPFLGPVALGLCRSLNLGFGMSLFATDLRGVEASGFLHLVAMHYFFYIAFLSSFARMEDSVVEKRRAKLELFAMALAVISLGIRVGAAQELGNDPLRWIASTAPLLVLASFSLLRSITWQSLDPGHARGTVIWLLGGIYLLDASVASFAWGPWGLLLLFPAALGPALRRSISAS